MCVCVCVCVCVCLFMKFARIWLCLGNACYCLEIFFFANDQNYQLPPISGKDANPSCQAHHLARNAKSWGGVFV